MKMFALLPLALASAALAQTYSTIPSMPLSTLQSSLGVDTHINYGDGLYDNEANVLADLQYIGVTNIRDSLPNPATDPADVPAHRLALAAAGIHYDFLTSCNVALSTELAGLDQFATTYPGSVLAAEGTNEINNAPCQGSGSNQANAVAYQRALYAAVHVDKNLEGIPVLDFTGGTNETSLTGQADSENTHPYPADDQTPFARLTQDFTAVYGSLALPRWITETGYTTEPGRVDDDTQGEEELNAYFDSALQGNVHTFAYQLLEAYPDFFTNPDTDYGMFRYEDNSPKPIAEALHALHDQIPLDKASAPKAVTAGFYPAISGDVHALALTASNGTIYLAIWNEGPIWNSSTLTRTDVPPTTQYVSIPGYKEVGYIDPQYDYTLPLTNQVTTYEDNAVYATGLFGFVTVTVFQPQ